MRQLMKTWLRDLPKIERMASDGHKMMLLEADKLEFYHGSLTEKKVERLFRGHMHKRGTYILRKSNTEDNALTISVVDNRTHIYHFRVNHLPDGKYVVGGAVYFNSIQQIVEHFRKKSVPGHENSSLLLTLPIKTKRITAEPPVDVLSEQQHGERTCTNGESRVPIQEFVERQQAAPPIQAIPVNRPPMPTPRLPEPIYNSQKHYYSAPQEREDHLDTILERCKEADEYFDKQCKKCSCGLYMWESELVQGWMMHRDTEGPDAQGQIFFLETQTNESAWDLPREIEAELKHTSIEKWENMKKLQANALRR